MTTVAKNQNHDMGVTGLTGQMPNCAKRLFCKAQQRPNFSQAFCPPKNTKTGTSVENMEIYLAVL